MCNSSKYNVVKIVTFNWFEQFSVDFMLIYTVGLYILNVSELIWDFTKNIVFSKKVELIFACYIAPA